MANFSGAIKIGDVNDFIAPSDACVLNFDGSLDAKSKVTIPPVRLAVALYSVSWHVNLTCPSDIMCGVPCS